MAVPGLGCPVRFTLTAGQKGDAPQAAALIEGLPAEVVMGDTAYDADHLRQAIAAKGALAVIPNSLSRPSNIRLCPAPSHAVFQSSSNSAVSQPASKRQVEIIGRSSPSRSQHSLAAVSANTT
jgi:transposase